MKNCSLPSRVESEVEKKLKTKQYTHTSQLKRARDETTLAAFRTDLGIQG